MTRYAHQNGFHVDRRFGWDCHGLPVEYEIDKTIGIKSPEDVLRMGVRAYNAECRKIVMRYSNEWEVRSWVAVINGRVTVTRGLDVHTAMYNIIYPSFSLTKMSGTKESAIYRL